MTSTLGTLELLAEAGQMAQASTTEKTPLNIRADSSSYLGVEVQSVLRRFVQLRVLQHILLSARPLEYSQG